MPPRYCICPNGRAEKRAMEKMSDNELSDAPLIITLVLTRGEFFRLLEVARREQLEGTVSSLEEVISHSTGLEEKQS
jgi:hypothetical protein